MTSPSAMDTSQINDVASPPAKAEESEDTSSDEQGLSKAFTFYPGGKPGGNSKRFYLEAPIIPGQTEPYVLPADLDYCPIEGCPAHESHRKFNPHWRLNEHMKTRHGWPRRQPQSGGVARRSSARKPSVYDATYSTRSTRARRESAVSNGSFPSSSSKRKFAEDDHVNDSSALSVDPSPARPTRMRRQTAKGMEMTSSIAKIDAATSQPAKRTKLSDETSSGDATISEDDSSGLSEAESQEDEEEGDGEVSGAEVADGAEDAMDVDDRSPSPPRPATLEQIRDHDLIAAIKSLCVELRAASRSSPDLATAAREYEEMIQHDLIRVNCQMSERNAALLASCYKRLAERHNARAMIFSMQSSSLAPIDVTVGRFTTGRQAEMGPPKQPSPPKAFTFINDAPKQPSKILKSNASTNGLPIDLTIRPPSASGSTLPTPASAIPSPGPATTPGANEKPKQITLKLNMGSAKKKDSTLNGA